MKQKLWLGRPHWYFVKAEEARQNGRRAQYGLIAQPLIVRKVQYLIRPRQSIGRDTRMVLSTDALVVSTLALAYCQNIAGFFVDIFGGGAGDWDPKRMKRLYSRSILDFALNALQASLRNLLRDITPPDQLNAGNAWHSRMCQAGNIVGYGFGFLPLTKLPFHHTNEEIKICQRAMRLHDVVEVAPMRDRKVLFVAERAQAERPHHQSAGTATPDAKPSKFLLHVIPPLHLLHEFVASSPSECNFLKGLGCHSPGKGQCTSRSPIPGVTNQGNIPIFSSMKALIPTPGTHRYLHTDRPPVEYTGEAADIIAIIQPIWNILPAPEFHASILNSRRRLRLNPSMVSNISRSSITISV
ncbi:hypothetical protein EDD22DRAFT_1024269 [Suillus occidentalis]|nr:hypothetical protein EDD22DRAFT_1024269 [Suillus occidentalis]